MKKKTTKGTSTTVAEKTTKTASNVNPSTTVKKKKKKVTSEKAPEPTTTVKKKKKSTVKVDDANAASVTRKAITDKKDLKYIYPTDADDIAKRKKFRAEVRRKVRALEKELYKLQMSKAKEDQELYLIKNEQYEKYCGEVYTLS